MSSPSIQNTQEEYAILGATQGIGNELLKLLLIRGVKVRVLARNPSSLSELASNPLLSIVKGDATNAKDVETLISTSQYKLKGVFCALGTHLNIPTKVVEQGTVHAIQAMKKHIPNDEETHFVLITSAALIENEEEQPWFFRVIVKQYLLNHIYDDLKRAEKQLVKLCENSNITYSIVRPPRLVDSCLTLDYDYRIGNDFLRNATNVMSRADVAAFMLRCMFDQTLKISAGSNQIFNVDTKRVLPKEHDSNFGLMTLLSWTLPRHQYLMIKMGVHSIQIAGVAMLAYYFFPQQASGWWNALSTSAVRFFGVSSTGYDHK